MQWVCQSGRSRLGKVLSQLGSSSVLFASRTVQLLIGNGTQLACHLVHKIVAVDLSGWVEFEDGGQAIYIPVWHSRMALQACQIKPSAIADAGRRSCRNLLAHYRGMTTMPESIALTASTDKARWAGRNRDKDALRDEIWSALERMEVGVGPVRSRIPNFVGADRAAWRLAATPMWRDARVIKCNPDPPQIPLRLRALYAGKQLYMPVPELERPYPFVLLDPAQLAARQVSFELAATSQGGVAHGVPVQFEDLPTLDLVVVGCVAVTRLGGRTGKGGGFADLELGIFRELGKLPAGTPIVTTVHSCQVVAAERLVMLGHDSALDWVFTEEESIQTGTPYPQPHGVAWDQVEPDQYRDIPFLAELRGRIEQGGALKGSVGLSDRDI
jgi:5-formyltetrahydrofolate cyclo-ligase